MNNSIDVYKYGEKSFPNGYNPFVVLFRYRYIANKIAILFKNAKIISPNQITVSGLMIFILSTLLISITDGYIKLFGIFIGPFWVFLDYLDGSLARLRGTDSEFGKKLDAIQDHLAFFLIPVGIFISISGSRFVNLNFYILILIYFNQYFYAVGIREIYQDGQLPYFAGNKYNELNTFQKFVIQRTKINIGFYTLFQGDTLFVVYWISSYFNISQISLIHFLLWSIFRNIILFKSYWRKYKDK